MPLSCPGLPGSGAEASGHVHGGERVGHLRQRGVAVRVSERLSAAAGTVYRLAAASQVRHRTGIHQKRKEHPQRQVNQFSSQVKRNVCHECNRGLLFVRINSIPIPSLIYSIIRSVLDVSGSLESFFVKLTDDYL